MSRLSKLERDALPSSAFAVPGKRKLLIQDASHLRFAWDELERTQGLSEAEREEARRRILARARELGIDTSGWMRLQTMSLKLGALAAMSLAVPTTPDHPNKLPFAGVLTKINEPSDKAPWALGAGLRHSIPTARLRFFELGPFGELPATALNHNFWGALAVAGLAGRTYSGPSWGPRAGGFPAAVLGNEVGAVQGLSRHGAANGR